MIFVQIASYRDPFLKATIHSLLNNASDKYNLKICICRQYNEEDSWEDINDFINDDRFIIINVLNHLSKGVGWARNIVQQYYNNEEFTLQVDSHMKFSINWDIKLINLVKELQSSGFKKPIITTYPPGFSSYEKVEDNDSEFPTGIYFDKILDNSSLIFSGKSIKRNLKKNWVEAKFLAAGFLFTIGNFCKEVEYDPDIYFIGEEISLGARAFTAGYDFFHPKEIIIRHYYKKREKLNWQDNENWQKLNEASIFKVRQLLGINYVRKEFNKYGLGKVRTFEEYQKYVGINFFKFGVTNNRKSVLRNKPYDKKTFKYLQSHSIDLINNITYLTGLMEIIFLDKDQKKIYKIKLYKKKLRKLLKNKNKLSIRFFSSTCPYYYKIFEINNHEYKEIIPLRSLVKNHFEICALNL